MNRRGFLGAVGGALLSGTAGCAGSAPSDSSTPGTDTASRSTATPTSTPATYRTGFRQSVGDRVERIEAMAVSDRRVTLRYVTKKRGAQELGGQIGAIAGDFYREVGEGWEVDRLDAFILDEGGGERGTWYAKREWFERFRDGELTADELSVKVLDTLQVSE